MIPLLADIRRATCEVCNISETDILSERRSRSVAWPRQMAMYLAREMTPRSLPTIAFYFGRKDHTTAIHAIKAVESRKRYDEIADILDAIRSRIRSQIAGFGDGVSGD